MLDFVQHWFYDTETSEGFKLLIEKLNKEFLTHEFNIDLEQFIDKNLGMVFTEEALLLWTRRFCFAAYLSELCAKNFESQLLLSLPNNNEFLKNIIRKSIYEYYIKQRWLLTNSKNTQNIFTKKSEDSSVGFEHMQLDMIISTIENLWVKA